MELPYHGTPKIDKKFIIALDFSKLSDGDYISVVVLMNSELEHSFLISGLFNIYLKGSYFPDYLKVSCV